MKTMLREGRMRPAAALLPRGALLAGLVALVLALGAERVAEVDWPLLGALILATPGPVIAAAAVFAALSHVALSGYDALAMGRIGRTLPPRRVLAGGFAGTVMGQTLGFGLVTGSLARARIYRANGLSNAEIVALSGFVAAGFFGGLGILVALLTLADPGVVARVSDLHAGDVRGLAACGLLLVAAYALRVRRGGRVGAGGLRLRAPDGRWLAGAALLAAADVVPAATCLWLFLPEGAIPLVPFVAVFAVALGLGHLSGAPAALGPFEGVLFLILGDVPATELAAAILLYRALYYVPPFGLAAWVLLRAPAPAADAGLQGRALDLAVARAMAQSPRAEAELAHLGDKRIFCPEGAPAFAMYGVRGGLWLMMGDPVGPRAAWDGLMDAFEARARAEGARVAVYKADAGSAGFWQARGLDMVPVGEDAVIDAAAFGLEGPERRELRRKLSGVRKAGVEVLVHAPGTAPLARLAPVAARWDAGKGGERGFSMGRWAPDFVRRHVVVEARREGETVAFATFWVSGDGSEWALDLMRQDAAPNGTMQALVVAGLEAAQAAGARRLSLGAAPLSGLEDVPGPLARLGRAVLARDEGLQGLRRFKETFRPAWEPRLVAARGGLGLAAALAKAHALIHDRRAAEPRPADDGPEEDRPLALAQSASGSTFE